MGLHYATGVSAGWWAGGRADRRAGGTDGRSGVLGADVRADARPGGRTDERWVVDGERSENALLDI